MWPSSPTSGHISGEHHNLKRYRDPSVHCSAICNSQDMEATYTSINRGMDKEVVVHIYVMEYYSSVQKDQIIPFAATWMDLEIIILSETSQTEKDKHHMISLTCGIWKEMRRIYLQNRNRLTDIENKFMVAKRERQEGGIN